MRALIFLRLTQITSCYAASVTQSGVTPVIMRAPNATTRFSSRSSNFLQFHPKSIPETISEGQTFLGGMPPDPHSRRATRALIAYWNPPFQNSRSATGMSPRLSSLLRAYAVAHPQALSHLRAPPPTHVKRHR